MKSSLKSLGDRLAADAMGLLPKSVRTAIYARRLHLDQPLSKKFVFKLAQTREELEACFHLLHDTYVEAGWMAPDPSGLRVTLFHALPTTSTLMCRYGNRIVGTVSLIRKSKLGFPMQSAFDLGEVRRENGNIAEVSALAIDPSFRSLGYRMLMSMLKFLYEYAEYRFDTRHLVAAVPPNQIGFYEDVLCFRRMEQRVAHYAFVNGAPAVGAHLDLVLAKDAFRDKYAHLPPAQNLYHFFVTASQPNSQFPHQRFHTTSDPVMTPELIDYFFNQRTQVFAALKPREVLLLHAIYDQPEYKSFLPPIPEDAPREQLKGRVHRRFSVKCPGQLHYSQQGLVRAADLTVYECSESVFCARIDRPLSVGVVGEVDVDLGEKERCTLQVEVARLGKHSNRVVMLSIRKGGEGRDRDAWLKFVHALGCAPQGGEGDKRPSSAKLPVPPPAAVA
jgi:ribosomal protein S18 acetylase RimI-like enzyme